MKKLIILIAILVLFSIPINVLSETHNIDIIGESNISNVIDSKNEFAQNNINLENQEINMLINTLSAYDSVFNRWSILFTALFTLLSFGVPLATYFFSIRPSEKVKKEINELKRNLDNMAEEKFNEFLEKRENERIKYIITQLNSSERINRIKAIKDLEDYKYKLNDEILTYIFTLLEENWQKLSDYEIQLLLSLIFYKKSKLGNVLLKKLLEQPDYYYYDDEVIFTFVEYLAKCKIDNYIDSILIWINKYRNFFIQSPAENFIYLLREISKYSEEHLYFLINSEKILDNIEDHGMIYSELLTVFRTNRKLDIKKLNESLLYEKENVNN